MKFVVFDTNSLLRAFNKISPHSDALQRLRLICDRIAISNPIKKEFLSKLHRFGLSIILFEGGLAELSRLSKIKRITRTRLIKARQKIEENHLPLPNDRWDHKFIEAALAVHASCIITTDSGLLSMDPYIYDRSMGSTIRIIRPEYYCE